MVKRSTDQNHLDYETLTPEMRESKQEHWLRIAGVHVVKKEDQENAIHGSQRTLFVNHRKKRMAEAYRERVSEVEVHLGSLLDNRAKITSKVSARDHLVIIDILPNVYFTHQNRDAHSVKSGRLRTGRLKINPAKNRRRMVTKVQWQY